MDERTKRHHAHIQGSETKRTASLSPLRRRPPAAPSPLLYLLLAGQHRGLFAFLSLPTAWWAPLFPQRFQRLSVALSPFPLSTSASTQGETRQALLR